MDGDARGVEAQPLILPKVKMTDGKVRDVLVLCSMSNSVRAFDANTFDVLWTISLGTPINGSDAIDMHTINDHWGILSTGVIDPDTQVLYVVAWISADGSPQKGVHSIFAMHISDGTQANAPVLFEGQLTPLHREWFRNMALLRKQRSSLALATVGGRKTIFFASGTVLETGKGAAGWIFAYDIATKILRRNGNERRLRRRYLDGGLWPVRRCQRLHLWRDGKRIIRREE